MSQLPSSTPDVDTIFEERAVKKDNEQFVLVRSRLFFMAALLAFALLLVIYYFSPESRVKSISVKGNDYLSRQLVLEASDIHINDLFYAQFPRAAEAKIEEHPMIASATVSLLHDNIIEIIVVEKQPIGYRYDDETPTLLCTDGSVVELTSQLMPILARVPYITGFNEDNATHLLTEGFKEVERQRIEEMAEVIQYPLSYDDEAIEIRMRDGGIFFTNYFSMALINDYPKLSQLLKNKDNCLYADNGTTVAAARACPWDEEETVLEYWTDEDGNYIYNKWGDRAVKHYYQDSEGNYYLDEEGNRILIPIDAYGQDIKDSDFLNHYFEGWYAKGYLDIPEEVLNPDEESTEEEKPEESAEPDTANEE